MSDAPKQPKGIASRKVLLAVLIAIVLCGVAYLVWYQVQVARTQADAEGREQPAVDSDSSGEGGQDELPDNPINFGEERSKNNDIYAWLYMEAAGINMPVLQSPADDSYYLTHDMYKQENPFGSAFTQLANKTDFSDPVTVIYAHDNEGLFKTLHDYEDPDFFEKNKEFQIFTPGHILTYTLVSAYKYDNRHILNSFDFSNAEVRKQYFASVQDPDSLVRNVNPDVKLDEDSKIVQLSTCMLNEFHGDSRYIVTGVLTDDQPTK